MLQSELVFRLRAQNPHLTQREADKVVRTVLGTIGDALARGDRVELRNFGAFTVRRRAARPGHNPRTGEPIAVQAKGAVYFRSGAGMKAQLLYTMNRVIRRKTTRPPALGV